MSVQASLSNALSGLTAASRSAEVVSSNVANAMTEGYARRDLDLATRRTGGVLVQGVSRAVDEILVRDRRLSDATVGNTGVTSEFYRRLEAMIGTPDHPSSLSGRIGSLDAALAEAGSRPDSLPRLTAVVDETASLARHLTTVSAGLQEMRREADHGIGRAVRDLNTSLANVADLNRQITAARQSGRDPSNLLDLRHQEIDRISRIMPLREIERDGGMVALFTPTGAALLDGNRPAVFGFEGRSVITPDMTIGSGALSGLTMNGKPIRTEGATAPIAGGELAAQFALRDTLAPRAQANLDALARDLVERFEAVDTAAGLGLLTDNGVPFDPADEVGLAGRLRVNDAALEAPWRLRDGLGAAVEGDIGDARRLHAYADALTTLRAPSSGEFQAARTAAGLAADYLSGVGAGRRDAEALQSFASSKNASFRAQELAQGVDTDQEMQKLLLIEQAYAANARVISAVDEMMKTLLRI